MVMDEDYAFEQYRQRLVDKGEWGHMLLGNLPCFRTGAKPLEVTSPVPPRSKPRSVTPKRSTVQANAAKVGKAVRKYRTAFTEEWNTTRAIEIRLGMGPSTAFKTLMSLLGRKHVTARPLDRFNHRAGWEWKWVGPESYENNSTQDS
jgi:hypothetical protein